MKTIAKNGGTKNGRKSPEKGVATKKEAQATCLPDGVVAPKEMAFLRSTGAILDHIRDGFKRVKGGLDGFDEDVKEMDEVAANELGLMPLVASIRELCPSLRESLDGVIAAASRNGQPERTVEQLWAVLGPIHSAANVMNELVQDAWMEVDDVGDDDSSPNWLVAVSNVVKNLHSAIEVGYAALTVAKLRAAAAVRAEA